MTAPHHLTLGIPRTHRTGIGSMRLATAWCLVGMLGVGAAQAQDAVLEPATVASSLLATHSHLRFSISSGARACDALASTATPEVASGSPHCLAAHKEFAQRLGRIAAPLIHAAQTLEPKRRASGDSALAGRQFEVYVADGMPGGSASSGAGHIAIAAELAQLQPSDDFLAFVLAREIAHVSLGHHEDNSAASLLASAAVTLFFPAVGFIKTAISLASSQMAANSRNRSQRAAADEFAQRLLDAAGHSKRSLALNLASVNLQPLGDSAWAQTLSASLAPLVAATESIPASATSVAATVATLAPARPEATPSGISSGIPSATPSATSSDTDVARLLSEADAVVFRNSGQTRR